MIRNDITFGFTSKSCVTRMAGQVAMLYPGACSFVCLAGTSLQALRISISADLIMRDSRSPAECFLMRDSHSPAEYFHMRLSLLQDSHTLGKAHPRCIFHAPEVLFPGRTLSPQLSHDRMVS